MKEEFDQMGKKDKTEAILELEKQIAAAVWLQAIGQAAEAVLFSKLLTLKNESGPENDGKRKIEAGLWIQTIGQTMEAIGVSSELSTPVALLSTAPRMIITGDLLQSAGAAIEASGGIEVLAVREGEFLP